LRQCVPTLLPFESEGIKGTCKRWSLWHSPFKEPDTIYREFWWNPVVEFCENVSTVPVLEEFTDLVLQLGFLAGGVTDQVLTVVQPVLTEVITTMLDDEQP